MPVAMTMANVSAAFEAAGGDRKRNWDKLSERGKEAYVRRLQEKGHEPEELSVLLRKGDAAQKWAAVHWLVRAEFCASVNEARTGFMRRRRAAAALRHAPREEV